MTDPSLKYPPEDTGRDRSAAHTGGGVASPELGTTVRAEISGG